MSSHSPPQKWGIQANWINPKSCMRLAEWCKNNIVSQDICDSLFFNIKASNKFHNFEFSSGFNSPSYLYQSQLNQILISNIMIEYYFFGLGHDQSQFFPRLDSALRCQFLQNIIFLGSRQFVVVCRPLPFAISQITPNESFNQILIWSWTQLVLVASQTEFCLVV